MKGVTDILNKNCDESNKTAEKTVSTHLDKIGFKDYRDKDRYGSFILINENIFETIVSPICPSLSSYSSHSSYYKGKKEKKSDECEMNGDEKNKNENVTNVTENDENDESYRQNEKCKNKYNGRIKEVRL